MDNTTEARARYRRTALGRAIRRHRGRLSQSELGEMMGVGQTSISNWETGRYAITVEQIVILESLLKIKMGTLLVEAGYLDPSVTGLPIGSALYRLDVAVSQLVETAQIAALAESFGETHGAVWETSELKAAYEVFVEALRRSEDA